MIILISSDKLNFSYSLGQAADEVENGLREKFIEKYGEDIYTKASKVVIVEDNFFNVIKDRYGPKLIGEHNDFLDEMIERHLSV